MNAIVTRVERGMCRASASAAPALKLPVREASLLVYRGICYGPASSTKTGHLSLGFSSQLGYHVTVLGPRAGQLCLWVSQRLGTTQVRSLETRTQPHSLVPHGEVCIYRDTSPTQSCYCFMDESVLSGDRKDDNNKGT